MLYHMTDRETMWNHSFIQQEIWKQCKSCFAPQLICLVTNDDSWFWLIPGSMGLIFSVSSFLFSKKIQENILWCFYCMILPEKGSTPFLYLLSFCFVITGQILFFKNMVFIFCCRRLIGVQEIPRQMTSGTLDGTNKIDFLL